MNYTAIQDTPIIVDLLVASNDTGWSVVDSVAYHDSCNSGYINLNGYPLVSGQSYQVSYSVLTITGSGSVRLYAGNTAGIARTAVGNYVETIIASGVQLSFFSDATCSVKAFNIESATTDTSNFQKNTIIYSPALNKWTSYYTMAPDYGFNMFIRTLLFQYGIMYSQLNGSDSRNNLFGTNYDSLIKFVENKNTTVVNHYQGLSIQSNQLLITTDDGIQTSLGQLSTLIDTDFEQEALIDSGIRLDIYDRYGVYMASFVADSDGDQLKGNYLIMQLQSTDSQNPMKLYTVDVKSSTQRIAAR